MVRTLVSALLLLAASSCAASFLLPSCCDTLKSPALFGEQRDRRFASTAASSSLAAGPSGFEAEHYVTDQHQNDARPSFANALATAGLAAMLLTAIPNVAHADGQTKEFKFPPIDFSDTQRCILKSSSMGQANAARDALFDLRQCQLAGVKASGYDLSGAGTLLHLVRVSFVLTTSVESAIYLDVLFIRPPFLSFDSHDQDRRLQSQLSRNVFK